LEVNERLYRLERVKHDYLSIDRFENEIAMTANVD